MTYFDDLETRTPEAREKALFEKLPNHLKASCACCPGLAEHLSGIELDSVTSRERLAKLPVLRKDQLMAAQQANPPFGGYADASIRGTRMFMSPGPVWEPQAPGIDPWATARAMVAAGIGPGARVHNAFSYHMTPGGFIMDEGARAAGCLVFPAGVGATEAQVDAIRFYAPDAYVGTPDFLKILLDKAQESGAPIKSLKRALVSGGALFPAMRAEYAERGVRVMQAYATADLGTIAYETEHDGEIGEGMVCNEDLIVEICRPGTGDPVADGEVGELVVTSFNPAYPLIRFGTGDLSAVLTGASPCGRTNLRLKGWMGRADQRTKVKGMFVDPRQVAQLVERHPEMVKARLVVERDAGNDRLTLLYEGTEIDTARVEATMQQVFNLRGHARLSDIPLPNDGLVIDDQRDYQGG